MAKKEKIDSPGNKKSVFGLIGSTKTSIYKIIVKLILFTSHHIAVYYQQYYD